MLKIWKQLPEDLIEQILCFAPNFRDNLMNCQFEMLDKHRPCYFKRVVAGFSPGISDDPTWHNFRRNDILTVMRRRENRYGPRDYMNFQLHAIEITPERPQNDHYYHNRDMVLYYGWSKPTNREFWNTILTWNRNSFEFSPGYY